MARSPTVETLAAFGVVFVAQWLVGLLLGNPFLFALAPPLSDSPWTLLTSVYAHSGLGHLLANAVALAVVGLVVERATTRLRFHAFFVATGVASGVAQVAVTGLVGTGTAVLGASGSIFALFGYLLAANRVTGAVLDRVPLPTWLAVGLPVGLAALVTFSTGAPGVALVAHFTGFLLGLLAGRLGVLAASPGDARSRSASY